MNYSKLTIEITPDEEYRVAAYTGYNDDEPLFERIYGTVRVAGMELVLDGAITFDARGGSPELNEVSAGYTDDDEAMLQIEQQNRDRNSIVVESHEV